MRPERLLSGLNDLGLLGRARILAARIDVTIDELDHGHRRIVAEAEASLQNAGVAAVAVLVASAKNGEELLHHGLVAQLRHGLAAGMQVAALAERDQLLDDR